MFIKKFLLLVLIGALSHTNMSADDKKNRNQDKNMKPFPTEICEAKTKEEFLEKCVGKRVQLKGTIAKTILHPDATYPDVSSIGGYTNQIHIDTEWGQVALISQKPIKCQEEAKVEVEGILRIAPLFNKNSKNANKSPYVQVLAFECK